MGVEATYSNNTGKWQYARKANHEGMEAVQHGVAVRLGGEQRHECWAIGAGS